MQLETILSSATAVGGEKILDSTVYGGGVWPYEGNAI